MQDWFAQRPELRALRVAAADLNGQPRGKRLPIGQVKKVEDGSLRFPFSVLNLDILGHDIADSPLVFESGDRDGVLRPTNRGPVPVPWLDTPTAMIPVEMFHNDGRPFEGDPRHALARVLASYAKRGLTPVCAVELEFYLIDDSGETFKPPRSPLSGRRAMSDEILSMRALDRFDGFLTDLYDGCEAMGIEPDAAISEGGKGQFEINLVHAEDAMKMADDAWLFKMLVKGIARQHGLAASFMAKPYPDSAGNGLHTHFSVLDADGRNVFDDGGEDGSDMLRHAIAGCLEAMPASTLIFAPHANSYARLVPGAHAPTGVAWAYENRTAAIRVPSGHPSARRIEHRVSGGDTNPYLMLAAVLGAAMNGIEDAATPPAPITGNAYALDLPQIPGDWASAMDAFEDAKPLKRIFAPTLMQNYVLTKRQELEVVSAMSAKELAETYLETV